MSCYICGNLQGSTAVRIEQDLKPHDKLRSKLQSNKPSWARSLAECMPEQIGLMMSTCTIMDETCYNCLPRAVSPSPANENLRKDISRKGERGRIAGGDGGGRGRAGCCNCDCGCPACLLGWLRSRRACLDSGLRRKSYVLPQPC